MQSSSYKLVFWMSQLIFTYAKEIHAQQLFGQSPSNKESMHVIVCADIAHVDSMAHAYAENYTIW